MQANASKFQYITFESAEKLPDNNELHTCIHYEIDLKSANCAELLDVHQSPSFKGPYIKNLQETF